MQIVNIQKDKKHCFHLETDDGKTFLVDTDVVAEKSLKIGQTLTEEGLKEILYRSDFVRAKERALWYLDRADHTEKALYEKLLKAGFSARACAAVLAWLTEYGMVDDVRFAERFAERCRENNISAREALQKMLLKGIPRDLARETLDVAAFDEAAQIRALIEKKYRNRLGDRAENEKVVAALVRKGFSFGAVRTALKAYGEELEYSEESV